MSHQSAPAKPAKLPLILISPHVEKKGDEFGDTSISLSETYQAAIIQAGGIPLSLPITTSRNVLSECVRRSNGVLLTGGDDVAPELYAKNISPRLRKTVGVANGDRDFRELILIDEVFRQHKPLLAICRGQQILNVAFGGTLIVDIPSQLPKAINHRRQDKKSQVVHEVALTSDSLLARITGVRRLGVNSTHHQAVARIAEPFQVTGKGDDGVIESMELKPSEAKLLPFMLSVQFHPERLAARYREHREIFKQFVRACPIAEKNYE